MRSCVKVPRAAVYLSSDVVLLLSLLYVQHMVPEPSAAYNGKSCVLCVCLNLCVCSGKYEPLPRLSLQASWRVMTSVP